jgi:hypothetical protein
MRRPDVRPHSGFVHESSATGFPVWTHLVAAVAFPVWSIGTDAHLYGIDTRYAWWQGFGTFMAFLTVAVLALVGAPAVALEAWAARRNRHPWTARVVVVCYVIVAGFIAFVPTELRFSGDTTPTAVSDVTLSLASYGIVVSAQAVAAHVVCRRWVALEQAP